MTRPQADVLRVAALLDLNISQAEAARRNGVPQRTVNKWAVAGIGRIADARSPRDAPGGHCHNVECLPPEPYAYLLGLYLGDGCLAEYPRGVYRIHITMCSQYPDLIQECRAAMGAVLPNKVSTIKRKGCVDVVSYSKHWSCLFPQSGPGRKHRRPIRLEHWQESIALDQHPRLLLRGLIHSDGWRGVNRVKGRTSTPGTSSRTGQTTSGASSRTRAGESVSTADRVGRWHMSVSRRSDVDYMDTFIGPKS